MIIDKYVIMFYDDEEFSSAFATDRKFFKDWNGMKLVDYMVGGLVFISDFD